MGRDGRSGLSADHKLVQALALNILRKPKQLEEQVFRELPKAELDNTGRFKRPLRQMRTFSVVIGI